MQIFENYILCFDMYILLLHFVLLLLKNVLVPGLSEHTDLLQQF